MKDLIKENPRKSYIDPYDLLNLQTLMYDRKIKFTLRAVIQAAAGLGLPLLIQQVDEQTQDRRVL